MRGAPAAHGFIGSALIPVCTIEPAPFVPKAIPLPPLPGAAGPLFLPLPALPPRLPPNLNTARCAIRRMRLSDDSAAVLHFILLGSAIVGIHFIGLLIIWPMLDPEIADFGAASIMGALIVLVVAIWSTMRDRRIANIERMVKALYDRAGLDGGNGGRSRHGDE